MGQHLDEAQESVAKSTTILLAKHGDSYAELVEKFNNNMSVIAKLAGVEPREASVAQYHGAIRTILAEAKARDDKAEEVPVIAPPAPNTNAFGFNERAPVQQGSAADSTAD